MNSMDDLFNNKPEGLIFHYTTQKGLMGIMREKCLWATDICYLNDTREFFYSNDLLMRMLNEKKKELKGPETLFLDYLLLQTEIGKHWMVERLAAIYVSSFSENGNLLSQWRGYSGSNGFSIGFDYTQLKPLMFESLEKLIGDFYRDVEQLKKGIYEN